MAAPFTILLLIGAAAQGGALPPSCDAHAPLPTANQALDRAMDATGLSRAAAAGRVIHFKGQTIRELRDLSDRPNPPFDATISEDDIWLDPATGVERISSPLGGGSLSSDGIITMVGNDALAPTALHGFMRWQRALDALGVLLEWKRRGDAKVIGRCTYIGYSRLTLERKASMGDERLLIDESDGLPVALQRTEPSYFLGPERVEYRFYNWEIVNGVRMPLSVVRQIDGAKDRLRILRLGNAATAVVSRDSATAFPANEAFAGRRPTPDSVRVAPEPFWSSDPPDTIRVGEHAFLLRGKSFTSAVALAGDTVFILDAAQGEARARQDSVWIGKLFPGKHAHAFVVSTDIWPHIAGLRYWAANGAAILVHPIARPTVDRALAKRWTAAPDLFERRRASIRVRVHDVKTAEIRGAGGLRIFAVDGASSEGVLAVYAAADGFLWASDRIQDVEQPSMYVDELVRAVQRNGLLPRWTSGPHLGVIAWSSIVALAR